MFRLASAILLLTCGFLAAPSAMAQSAEDVLSQIEALHGDADGFSAAFDVLQQAMADGDAATVAEFGSYPLTVRANGEVYDVLEAQDLIDNFDSLIAPDTQTRVANQDVGDLMVNSEGVMIGAGELWLSAVCDDNACNSARWRIIAINN
ncbi:hypothetical protein VSX64_06240 [Aurantimonas sp. C2-6-R+9]|uniref:hypothetical protein n=1 Tax=unclassified Aurantimonas TaxID=2638230 RepID=UPI002E19E81C|nr:MULTISPECIES: hypothetical protein [unclassified Aurantimonas]MEC5290504.1 hypothetical protein [Aurantimonas sp. C2-3-R2]MEC5380487.1 hypothetical protein [Aurantimonas sp. C2-6-R+9]MEC5411533.1 hypothetical protein [Aurantimonas sp. C2-4-R8]